jgi:hypothetical protein
MWIDLSSGRTAPSKLRSQKRTVPIYYSIFSKNATKTMADEMALRETRRAACVPVRGRNFWITKDS